jgi:hypothetical protein
VAEADRLGLFLVGVDPEMVAKMKAEGVANG